MTRDRTIITEIKTRKDYHKKERTYKSGTGRVRDLRKIHMTRGHPPRKAQKDATPIAEKRGEVWPYQPKSGSPCDFTIISPGRVTFVCVKHIRRLRCTTNELLRKFPETIVALRLVVSSTTISRELWICSPRGAWRFFRIGNESVTELGTNGEPLTAGTVVVPGIVSGALIQMPAPGEVSVERMGFTSEKTPASDIKGV
jgi:hypothetical protein